MADAEPVIRGCAGTAMYMAPEVLNGEYYGFKADWWSVGATCFNLFEGSVCVFSLAPVGLLLTEDSIHGFP